MSIDYEKRLQSLDIYLDLDSCSVVEMTDNKTCISYYSHDNDVMEDYIIRETENGFEIWVELFCFELGISSEAHYEIKTELDRHADKISILNQRERFFKRIDDIRKAEKLDAKFIAMMIFADEAIKATEEHRINQLDETYISKLNQFYDEYADKIWKIEKGNT